MTMHVKGVGLKFPDGTEQSTAAVGGTGDGTGGSGVYTKEETDAKLAGKANVGVSYTKAEADNLVDSKADTGVSYTKAETEARLATKADAADLDSAMKNAVPTGMIMLWSSSVGSIPSGWAICDGTNGTPNLRDKFVVGAGGTYYAGLTGGSANAVNIDHSHSASSNSTGNHTHSVSGSAASNGNHSHTYTNFLNTTTAVAGGGTFDQKANGSKNLSTGGGGAHTHTISGTAANKGAHTHTITVNKAGASGTNKNLPPYYALAYIMKIT